MRWRFIDTGAGTPEAQMEADRRLLESLPGDGTAVWRVYRWSPWAISLGHHQDAGRDVDLDLCRTYGVPVVRRPTGGRAVYHAEELTYAVALPQSSSLPGGIAGAYGLVAETLVAALGALGVEARSGAASRPAPSGHQGACFASAARHEIVVGGKKLVGSALRRTRGGALQHGSILIGPAHARLGRYLLPPLSEDALLARATCLHDLLGRDIAYAEIAEALRRSVFERWGPPVA